MMTIPHKVLRNSNLFPEELTKNSAPPPPLNWLADLGPRRPKLQFYFCFGSNDHILLLYYVILLFDVPRGIFKIQIAVPPLLHLFCLLSNYL